MKKIISAIIHVIRNEKKKILFFICATIFFIFVLFPFSDIGDLVSAQISKATNNQVFVNFRNPGFSIFPGIGFELNDVRVETNFLPPIQAQSITVSPSIKGLLTLKPGVTLNANKILGGDIDLSLQQSSVGGKKGQTVGLDTDNVELAELLKLVSMNFPMTGKLSMTSSAEIESTFSDQPEAQIQLQVDRFNLASDTISTPLGPLNLPPLSLGKIILQGDLREGRFNITQLTAGQSSEELSANVKGRMDLRVQPGGSSVSFVPGPFDLEVRFVAKESFQQKAGLFLSFLNSYKKPGPDGSSQYAFRLKGMNFQMPPNITAL